VAAARASPRVEKEDTESEEIPKKKRYRKRRLKAGRRGADEVRAAAVLVGSHKENERHRAKKTAGVTIRSQKGRMIIREDKASGVPGQINVHYSGADKREKDAMIQYTNERRKKKLRRIAKD